RVAIADLYDAVDRGGIVRVGPEVLTDAFDEVGPAAPARVHRPLRVGADHLHGRVLRLEVPRHTRDGAAGADPGNEMRDPARGLPPDLGARRALVRERVLGVVILARLERAGDLGREARG